MWGWSEADREEELANRALFKEIDADGGGTLDKEEVAGLITKMGIKLNQKDLQSACAGMGLLTKEDTATFDQFNRWFHLEKYGMPKMPRAPLLLLEEFSSALEISAFAPGDIVSPDGRLSLYTSFLSFCAISLKIHKEASFHKYPGKTTHKLRYHKHTPKHNTHRLVRHRLYDGFKRCCII